MINYINFKNLNSKHKKNNYFIPIGENTYIFKVEWNDYCNCAFFSIYNDNNEAIIMGKPLSNRLLIRNYNFPYNLFFFNSNGETYEPTIDNIEKEYVMVYDDGEG